MPQLTPDPWFFILLSSWFILIILTPRKILSHVILNNPDTKNMKMDHPTWNWPW